MRSGLSVYWQERLLPVSVDVIRLGEVQSTELDVEDDDPDAPLPVEEEPVEDEPVEPEPDEAPALAVPPALAVDP